MNLKVFLYQKGIRQVDIVRELNIDPGRISQQINGIRPLPANQQKRLCKFLGLSQQDLEKLCAVERKKSI